MADSASNKCNLIVNYIPQSFTDQEFYDLFMTVGKTTSTRIIRDKATNYSFGYGFVSYETPEDAAKAIAQLNGTAIQHKVIKVALSQPSGSQTKNINLHVSGLPEFATEHSVREIFQPYGSIVQCRVIKDRNLREGQGIAFVLFTSRDEALVAIKAVNGILFPDSEDNIVSVKFAKTEQKGPSSTYMKRMGQLSYNYNTGRQVNGGRGGRGVRGGRGGGPMRGHAFVGRYSPMTPRGNMGNAYGSSTSGAGDARYQPPPKETIIFVYGIGPITDENGLWQMFGPYGTIVRVNVIWDHTKGVGKGYGFVTFQTYNEAVYAVQSMNGFVHEGRALQVSIKNE